MKQTVDLEGRVRALEAENTRLVAERRELLLASSQKERELSEKDRELAVLGEQLAAKNEKIEELHRKLEQALRRLYGPRAEKLDVRQISFAFLQVLEDEEKSQKPDPTPEGADSEPDVDTVPRNERKRARGLRDLPKDLPREERRHEPAPYDLKCVDCGGAKRAMGEEVTELLDFVPASLHVVRHVRTKYSCAHCQEGVVIADRPTTPLERARPGAGLLAHLINSKFNHHLPLYRLREIYASHGVEIARSTLSEWTSATASTLLSPIVKEMRRSLLERPVVQSDDTPVRVLNEGPGTHRASIWVYRGAPGEVVFEARPDRKSAGPLKFLEGFKGYLQADAYSGYDAVFEDPRVIEVGCWAHVRRKFYDARSSALDDATRALADIGRLYHLESQARERRLDAEAIKSLRSENARPIVEEFFAWAEEAKKRVLPKSPIGVALTYALNQRVALSRFLDDGRLEIDNNAVERAIRPVAVGRKNWLFAGNDAAAEAGAVLYSLVVSCKELGVDPFVYLRDVIERVSTHPASRVAELTPRGWHQMHTR